MIHEEMSSYVGAGCLENNTINFEMVYLTFGTREGLWKGAKCISAEYAKNSRLR